MNERYFIEMDRNDDACLLESKGDFRNHGDVDLLIAKFYNEQYAEIICKLLNEQAGKI